MDVNRVKHGFKALISQIRTFGDRNPAFTMRLRDQFDAVKNLLATKCILLATNSSLQAAERDLLATDTCLLAAKSTLQAACD